MKTSASSWSYHRLFAEKKMDLFGWLDECAKLELDGVELLENHIPSKEESFLRRVKKACTDRFLTIAMLSAGGHLTTTDDTQRRRDVEEIGKWMDAALYVGAPLVRFFCGSGTELEAGGKALYTKVLAAMKEIAALGEQRGIVAALENHGNTTADQLLSLHRDVNSPGSPSRSMSAISRPPAGWGPTPTRASSAARRTPQSCTRSSSMSAMTGATPTSIGTASTAF